MLITEKRLQTYTILVYVGPVSMMLWLGVQQAERPGIRLVLNRR